MDNPDTNAISKRVIVQAILIKGTWTSMNAYKITQYKLREHKILDANTDQPLNRKKIAIKN